MCGGANSPHVQSNIIVTAMYHKAESHTRMSCWQQVINRPKRT